MLPNKNTNKKKSLPKRKTNHAKFLINELNNYSTLQLFTEELHLNIVIGPEEIQRLLLEDNFQKLLRQASRFFSMVTFFFDHTPSCHDENTRKKHRLSLSKKVDPIHTLTNYIYQHFIKKKKIRSFLDSSYFKIERLFNHSVRSRILHKKKILQHAGLKAIKEKENFSPQQKSLTFYDTLPPIQPVPRNNLPPLFHELFRLAFLELLSSNKSSLNRLIAFRISGPLDTQALEKSLLFLIKRHESLRMGINLEDKSLVIQQSNNIDWKLESKTINIQSDAEPLFQSMCQTYVQKKFVLNQPPLLRAQIIKNQLEPDNYYLLCAVHPLSFDTYSENIFSNELWLCYEYFQNNQLPAPPLRLPSIALQPIDYYEWAEKILLPFKQKQLSYWKETLSDVTPLELPFDFPRSTEQKFLGNKYYFEIPAKVFLTLNKLSDEIKVDLFTLLLASFQYFLFRYTDENDICIGTLINNREKGFRIESELRSSIGHLTNSVAVRTKFTDTLTLESFILNVKANIQKAFENSDITYGELINSLKPNSDHYRNPFYNSTFVMRDCDQEFYLKNTTIKRLQISERTSRFDLSLEIQKEKNCLKAMFEYNSSLFKEQTIERMADNYITWLTGFDNKLKPLRNLDILSPKEEVLLKSFQKPISYNQTRCVHQIFEDTATIHGQQIAVTANNGSLTYKELDLLSNCTANSLLERGIKPGSILAICMERSIEAEIIVLGIFKAGCSIVFVESAHKELNSLYKKLDTIMPSAVIFDQATEKLIMNPPDTYKNIFDSIKRYEHCDLKSSNHSRPQGFQINIDSLALVSMTSGSTGKPKGVLVRHRGWDNWVCELLKKASVYKLTQYSNIFMGAPYIFDASLWERLLAYGFGARLFLNSSQEYRDPEKLKIFFAKNKITIATFTPSFLKMLNPFEFSTLECIFVVGESLSIELIKKWKEAIPGLVFINGYGPTESTAGITLYECDEKPPVLIGKPIQNMQVHILDQNMKPTPLGAYGEIYLKGVGIAQGYYKDLIKTNEVFIPNGGGEMLYRTGDKARFMPDGNIEFKCRMTNDKQLKLHGVRIELEEIESLLALHPKVEQAIIKVIDDAYLVAYVLPKAGMTINDTDGPELKSFLKNNGLTTIKLPLTFISIDTIPLTKNGKLDKTALPTPLDIHSIYTIYEPPKTPTEFKLQEIFQEVLSQKIGRLTDFSDMDSLLLVALAARINVEFFKKSTYKLAIIDLQQALDIETLGALIDHHIPIKNNNIITNSMDKLCEDFYASYSN